jgi:hypothetical protein
MRTTTLPADRHARNATLEFPCRYLGHGRVIRSLRVPDADAVQAGGRRRDISARRASCRVARRIARLTPSRCEDTGTCTVRGYTCFAAAATDELTFARCSKARDDNELYRTVRFDYGR